MRKNQFRAWDDGAMIHSHNNNINNDSQQLSWFFNKIREDAIVMQFTGLHDENGKEIYEGDIVERIPNLIHLVEWNDDTCKFQFSDGSDINDCNNYGISKIVIGNIYQHPELLNDQ